MNNYKCPNCNTYENSPYFVIIKCLCGIYKYLSMSTQPKYIKIDNFLARPFDFQNKLT